MYKYIKRFIDFMIALVALIILFVPLIIVAIIIKLDSKGPVIFKQDRLGKNGVPFKIWKFRSMSILLRVIVVLLGWARSSVPPALMSFLSWSIF